MHVLKFRSALSQEGHIRGLKTCRKVILLVKEKITGYNVAAHLQTNTED